MENQIFLKPAYAALTLAGVNTVVGLRERPSEFKKRLPIFSRGLVYDIDSPVEFIMEGHNQIVFGNIPPINGMAYDSFAGVVEIGWEADEHGNTLWNKMAHGHQFHIIRSFIFDNSLRFTMHDLWKMTADEMLSVFPFHTIDSLNSLMDLGTTLEVEMGKYFFEKVNFMREFDLDLTPKVKEVVLDEEGNLKNFKYLLLSCGNLQKRFEFNAEIKTELKGNDEPMLYNSVFDPTGKSTREQIVFECKTQLLW